MNVLITLPQKLIDKIISGDKRYEMRKCIPKNMRFGYDGFFIVQKGTDIVKCWCRVDSVISMTMNESLSQRWSDYLCVRPEFILNYAPDGTDVWLWEIGEVVELSNLSRDSLQLNRNPQNFAYCPLSYGEPFLLRN